MFSALPSMMYSFGCGHNDSPIACSSSGQLEKLGDSQVFEHLHQIDYRSSCVCADRLFGGWFDPVVAESLTDPIFIGWHVFVLVEDAYRDSVAPLSRFRYRLVNLLHILVWSVDDSGRSLSPPIGSTAAQASQSSDPGGLRPSTIPSC